MTFSDFAKDEESVVPFALDAQYFYGDAAAFRREQVWRAVYSRQTVGRFGVDAMDRRVLRRVGTTDRGLSSGIDNFCNQSSLSAQ